jgi:hypothetical protein
VCVNNPSTVRHCSSAYILANGFKTPCICAKSPSSLQSWLQAHCLYLVLGLGRRRGRRGSSVVTRLRLLGTGRWWVVPALLRRLRLLGRRWRWAVPALLRRLRSMGRRSRLVAALPRRLGSRGRRCRLVAAPVRLLRSRRRGMRGVTSAKVISWSRRLGALSRKVSAGSH